MKSKNECVDSGCHGSMVAILIRCLEQKSSLSITVSHHFWIRGRLVALAVVIVIIKAWTSFPSHREGEYADRHVKQMRLCVCTFVSPSHARTHARTHARVYICVYEVHLGLFNQALV